MDHVVYADAKAQSPPDFYPAGFGPVVDLYSKGWFA
jgi:hypothetical protein